MLNILAVLMKIIKQTGLYPPVKEKHGMDLKQKKINLIDIKEFRSPPREDQTARIR